MFDLRQVVRTSFSIALVVLLAAFNGACDTQKEISDEELFQRARWELDSVHDDQGDRTVAFAELGVLTIDFEADDTFAFRLNAPQAEERSLFSGGYVVEPVTNSLPLTTTIGGQGVVIPVRYRFNNDSEVELTLPGALLASATEFDFAGDVTFTLHALLPQ